MKLDWKYVVCALLVGGLAGGWLGARCQRAAFHRVWQKGFDTEKSLRKFNRELNLDPTQQESVKGILEKSREKIVVLHKEMGEIRLAMRSEIRKTLKPEQQKKFDEMSARWDARHKQEESEK